MKNMHWGFMSIGFLRLYHYLVLQPLSYSTEVNLNSMMCPAISDPFKGPWYRMAANTHQTAFILLHGKIYCALGNKFFAPKASKPKSADVSKAISQSSDLDANGNNLKEKGCKSCSCCSESNKNL